MYVHVYLYACRSVCMCVCHGDYKSTATSTLSVIGVGLRGIMCVCMYVYTLFKSTHADKTLPMSVVHSRCQVTWPMHPSKNFQIFAKILAFFATPKFGDRPRPYLQHFENL